MKKFSMFAGGAVVIALGWFLGSPLFINEVVDEALPTNADLMAMPMDVREKVILSISEKMAKMPDKTMQEEMMSEAEPTLIKQGQFKDADAIHKGSGNALLYQLADDSHLLRLEDFTVTNGPDLMVYLIKNTDTIDVAEVKNNHINLGDLKGNIGNQNYLIPAGVDIVEYNTAVIWCELFGVLFSPASLSTN